MRFNKFKTRETKLKNKLNSLLNKIISEDKINDIIKIFNEYERDNLNTINKLKKDKEIDSRKIIGGLKQTINAHGPITKELIGSATKRILGSLLVDDKNKDYIKIHKSNCILFLMFICVIIVTLFIKASF